MADQGVTRLVGHSYTANVDVGLDKAPVPLGSVFVYDGPVEQWELIGASASTLSWRGPDDQAKLTTLSTILPALRWHGVRSGRRTFSEVSGALHPLKIGNTISFHEETLQASPPGTFSGDWTCEVQDRAKVTVPAGTFDTWQVLCKVNGLEYLLANYNEQLGNNVRLIYVTDDNTVRVRQLVSSSLLQTTDK